MNEYEAMKKIVCKEIELTSMHNLYQLVEKFKKIYPMAYITFLNKKELKLRGIPNKDPLGRDFFLVNQPVVEKELYTLLKLMDGTVHKIIRNEIVEYEQWGARIQYIEYD